MNANNDEIVFYKEEKETLINKLQGHCANELDIELSHFDAAFIRLHCVTPDKSFLL